ncbi:SpoIID/LytB domain-containing protein [bacterium]|nr:SpoIID/LytB domain-containing protein [bacterium]
MTGLLKISPLRLIWVLALFIGGCLHAAPGQAGGDEKVRVLILRTGGQVELKGTDRGDIVVRSGTNGTILLNGSRVALPVMLYPKGRFISVNGKPYRGVIKIAAGEGQALVINEIGLEAYVAGIINNEISSRWPEEVLKTQAVIARTYAVYNMRKRSNLPYHLESSVMGQVYGGASSEDSASIRAVMDTRGEILVFEGEPALTVYHSNAGGMTEAASEVWLKGYPYLVPVESPFDESAPRYIWEFAVSAESLGEALSRAGHQIGAPEELRVIETTSAARIRTLSVRDREGRDAWLSGEELRKVLGYSSLRSTIFEVAKEGEVFVFRGRGSGHGVGLSQWGAKGMAENGYSYRDILRHFYPGTELQRGPSFRNQP